MHWADSVSKLRCPCVVSCLLCVPSHAIFYQRSSSVGRSLWEGWLWSPPPPKKVSTSAKNCQKVLNKSKKVQESDTKCKKRLIVARSAKRSQKVPKGDKRYQKSKKGSQKAKKRQNFSKNCQQLPKTAKTLKIDKKLL